MRNVIGYRIVTLFLMLSIASILVSIFYIRDEMREDRETYIKSELMEKTLKSTAIFLRYHEKIFSSNNYYIDPQAYLDIVREVSAFANGTDLEYIKSYIKFNGKFLLTATSASDEEFRAESYDRYGKESVNDIDILSQAYDIDGTQEIFIGDRSAIQLEINNHKYLILTKINRDKLDKSLDNNFSLLIIMVGVLFPILILLLFMLSRIHREIVAIDITLRDFFDYALRDKNIEDIRYIQRISGNQLGQLSTNINHNIKEIIEDIHSNRKREIFDNRVISELIIALNPTLDGSFVQKVDAHTDSENLNTLKEIVNSMMLNMDRALVDINHATTEYINQNYIPSITEENYKDKILSLVKNINQLGKNHSTYLLGTIEHLIEINGNAKFIETHIENSSYTLNDILISTKKIVHTLEGDYKFAFEFDNSIKVIKQENVYVNNLLDNFGSKYEASISLIDDLKSGLFDNDKKAFIHRIDEVIKDSSIRDSDAQKELIDKVRELTNNNIIEASTERVRGLLRLLLEELLKDIRYSLYLIEEKVEKLASDSSTRLSSFKSIENISKELRDMIVQDLENIQKIQDIASIQINKTNDIKYSIIEDNQFIGKKEISRLMLQKGEL